MDDRVRGDERDDALYKRDSFLQCYVDRRYLATILKFMEDIEPPRSISDLGGMAIQFLSELIVKEFEAEPIHYTKEADKIIYRKFRNNLNKDGRGGSKKLYNLELDAARKRKVAERLQANERKGSEEMDELSRKEQEEMENIVKGVMKEFNPNSGE